MTWRPATLKTRFIFGTALICALLIAGVEVVLQISNRNNGLIFADENGRFPSYTLFCFEYLPTLISILHSLIWICIDHDLRRAEPFFQLSKPGGATAKESLLLDYPYQFVLAVGWSSFKRR